MEEVVPVLRQVAAALDYAHGERVVHRDVKPGNVMIDGRGRVKVLDFGLAAQIRTSLSRASQAYRGTSGTGPYMAPEQWEAQPQDEKTDQYALGVMAYEMLAGRPPFESSELGVLREVVLKGEVRGIAGLSEGAMGALRRALAKKAEERWESCGAFVEALAEGRGAGSRPAARAARMADDAPAATDPARGGEDLFLRKVRLEKAMGAAREEDATEEEKTALAGVQERFEAGIEALRMGDKWAAENLFGQVEGGLAIWRKGGRERREREEREARAEREAARERIAADLRAGTPQQAGEVRAITLPGGGEDGDGVVPAGSVHDGESIRFLGIGGEVGRMLDETPHRVTLTKGFWMAKMEVTQGQWKSVMGSNPSHFRGDDLPVECVSWDDCQEFCKKTGLQLPTEAQWEYACRAGTTGAYAGTGKLDDMGWYSGNSGGEKTHPVGQKRPNAWGLYDMHGNVWEWCADWYDDYPKGAVTDPPGPPTGSRRVSRGGSWLNLARGCHSATRYDLVPGYRLSDLGLRVALLPVQ